MEKKKKKKRRRYIKVIIIIIIPTYLYLHSHKFVNSLVSQKCALLLDVPKTWFNDWPDDDSVSRNMSPKL
jgi:ABC-type uncharacterized transport system substrate-binding protein